MVQLEIKIHKVEPLYDVYAKPTVKFVGEIINRVNEKVFLVYLQCDIALKDKNIKLGSIPIVLSDVLQNQTKNFEIIFGFSIDSNNIIHDLLKQQELEDVNFSIALTGFCLYGPLGQPLNSTLPLSITNEVSLPIDKYRRLLSTYYRDIAWISISRETYHNLSKLKDEKGVTTLDELIKSMI